MAMLTQLFSKLKSWKETPNADPPRMPTREENISRVLGKVEPYVVFLQRVLIWENPKQSVLFILALHGLFWFVVALELRLFFLVFGTILIVLIYKVWVEKVWPEIGVPLPAEQVDTEEWTPLHPRVLSAPEISHHLNNVILLAQNTFTWLRGFRNEQPGMFCCVMSTVCLVLMWIGLTVSGTTLLYGAFMTLLLTPGVFIHLLPPSTLANLLEWQNNLQSSSCKDNDIGEYMLEPSVSDLVLLHQAGEPDNFTNDDNDDDEFNMPSADFRQLPDDFTDSGAPSLMFLHGLTTMPSPEDLSLDSADFSFGLPKTEKTESFQRHGSETITIIHQKNHSSEVDKPASDSDDSVSPRDDEGIHFRTKHFKKDSSSEEEAGPLTDHSGKCMSEAPQRSSLSGTVMGDAAAAVLSYSSAGALNLASFGAVVGQSLISSVLSSSSSQPSNVNVPSAKTLTCNPVKEEDDFISDTDDFEMISEEEFANL